MKKNICCILFCLITICIIYISTFDLANKNVVVSEKEIKYVDSEILVAQADSIEEIVEEVVEDSIVYENIQVEEVVEVIEEKKVEEQPVVKQENEILVGKMSGYGPDCVGCSGYLAYGTYVGDGNIYYNDSEYGQVRIVAGDKKYKFGTIVKINDSMLAIVLDRGGSIGIGKKFMFDLLYSSEAEAYKNGVSNNTKFEILRYGF